MYVRDFKSLLRLCTEYVRRINFEVWRSSHNKKIMYNTTIQKLTRILDIYYIVFNKYSKNPKITYWHSKYLHR